MKLKPLTTKINTTTLVTARYRATYYGTEAFANDEGIDEFRSSLATAYGYTSWDVMPQDLKSDATKHYMEGRRIEKKAKAQ